MTKPKRPRSLEEKLGNAWGLVFVGFMILLTVVLFGKGCFFSG